jgi:small-conductance mechanosensitive channel
MNTWWEQIYFGNSISDWAIALGIIIAGFIILYLIKRIALRKIKKWAGKTETSVDDIIIAGIENSVIPLLYFLIVFAAINYLTVPEKIMSKIKIVAWIVTMFYILKSVTQGIRYFIFGYMKNKEESEARRKQANGLILIINIGIWIVGFIFLLGNLGYNITTLIAGLGVGGIAIALAAQTILGDLFAYFVIYFDKPFEIGDFISFDDKAGVVEYVGIKTTRIRILNGEQLVCSNKDLTDSRVHNFGRMEKRRVILKIGVVYQTTTAQLKRIPGLVKNIIESVENVTFDRAHFMALNNSSLDFEIVYYILSSDYNVYMDKQQEILLAIFEAFEKEKIDFAYPTQTLFVEQAKEKTETRVLSKERY